MAATKLNWVTSKMNIALKTTTKTTKSATICKVVTTTELHPVYVEATAKFTSKDVGFIIKFSCSADAFVDALHFSWCAIYSRRSQPANRNKYPTRIIAFVSRTIILWANVLCSILLAEFGRIDSNFVHFFLQCACFSL